jgi:hypothetical protein
MIDIKKHHSWGNTTDSERFFHNVTKTDSCWIWTGAIGDDGYGRFRIGPKIFRSHRYVYEFYYKVDPDNLLVCHTCDNIVCVNPEHLFLGTQADNSADRDRKGRQAKGEGKPNTKLTDKIVSEIRQLRSTGLRIVDIARKLVLPWITVWKITSGRAWRHTL